VVSSMQCACAILYCHLLFVHHYSTFPHYLINGKTFEKKFLNMKYEIWFSQQTLYETFLIWRRSEQYMIKNIYCCAYRVPLFLLDFNEIRVFLTNFRKMFNYQISWNSVQWKLSCSMWRDGRKDRRTDMTKLILFSCNFANVPKRSWYWEGY
jgi:hypothetical protein